MRQNAFFFILLLFFQLAIHARADKAHAASQSHQENVILITLDGVRWQDFFSNRPDPVILKEGGQPPDDEPLMPVLWNHLARQGVVYGQSQQNQFTVANPANWSLPGYQSMMAGTGSTGCGGNDCGPIKAESLPERLMRELNLKSTDAATFGSWKFIGDAVERASSLNQGNGASSRPFVNVGLEPFIDPAQEFDFDVDRMNVAMFREQMPVSDVWEDVRKDRYTMFFATYYLLKYKPRFLFVSLNDSDSWAHDFNYPKVIESLRSYDLWIEKLLNALKGMGDYGKNTTLILTTDHGRGNTPTTWAHHGRHMPEAGRVWLFAKGPHVRTVGTHPKARVHTHADIRPTIEYLLGVCPIQCTDCGKPLSEVISYHPAADPCLGY